MLRNLGDSLFGRNLNLEMYPLLFREIARYPLENLFKLQDFDSQSVSPEYKPKIESYCKKALIFGTMPAVWLAESLQLKQELLTNYQNSLLFKDIFELEGIRNPKVFQSLTKLLALQIGNEVSYQELAKNLQISVPTVAEYISLLEKFKIIFILKAYSTNPRKEISKGQKVYFTDLGVRNALIQNFVDFDNRTDLGNLWENLVISQIKALISYYNLPLEIYFWRNYNQAEVDLILQNTQTGKLSAFEIKFKKSTNPSSGFLTAYKDQIEQFGCINIDNFYKYC
jgi:predicted AAA+ superfamily ATPase